MIITTRDFGEIDVPNEDVFTTKSPILGFEDYTKFTVLKDSDIGNDICWLQSIEEPNICFILVAATGLGNYSFAITDQIKKQLCVEKDDFLSRSYCIAVIADTPTDCTVNKKAPVIFSEHNNCFGQYVLDEDFPIKAPLLISNEEE